MTVELILLTFLEKQKDASPEYKEAVENLAGNIDRDGKLETDGISPFRDCREAHLGSLPGLDEDLCRRIGAQLAELGDMFERDMLIKQEVVEGLTNEILNNALTENRFEMAVQSLMKNVPAGIEQEKASLTVAMLLTRKIGENIPSLLHSCFSTATNFIRVNYNSYLESLARQS